MFAMIDEEIVEDLDDSISARTRSRAGRRLLSPAFMKNSQTEGKTGAFHSSARRRLYWNKEAFEAGRPRPRDPPTTWDEMVEMGSQLSIRDDAGNVTQWGLAYFPPAGFPPPGFSTGLVAPWPGWPGQRGGHRGLFRHAGSRRGARRSGLAATEHGIMAPGTLDWGATRRAFMDGEERDSSWTTTRQLTNIRNNATFDFGVGMLPGECRPGAPSGGGNFTLLRS